MTKVPGPRESGQSQGGEARRLEVLKANVGCEVQER